MVNEEHGHSPKNQKQTDLVLTNEQSGDLNLISPGFRSVAALAGWDEESILIASLIVEDTPDRDLKHCKQSPSLFNAATPPSHHSKRKRRRLPRKSPIPIDKSVFDLEEEKEPERQEHGKNDRAAETGSREDINMRKHESVVAKSNVPCSNSMLPCLDKLMEELSCAICLEICFEPSTTSCGHSFCKTCLRSAADKCGKRCPKCRQLISHVRSCTVNTVLWNTIQLLFPREVEARRAAGAATSSDQNPERKSNADPRNRCGAHQPGPSSGRRGGGALDEDEDFAAARRLRRDGLERTLGGDSNSTGTRRRTRRWDGRVDERNEEDAALALRLQTEELMMMDFERVNEQSQNSFFMARANLRAMASRAIRVRLRRPHG